MNIKEQKEDLETRKFWLALEELTLLLKENHKEIVSMVKHKGLYKPNQQKDIEIIELSLRNLGHELKEIK